MNPDILNAVLTLDVLSTRWRVQLDPDEMEQFARRCMYYNEMTQEGMLRLLQDIDGAIPRMQFQEGNPNNGKPAYCFYIGNEGSRVLYLEVRKTMLPHKIDTGQLERQLRLAAIEAGANEHHVVEEDKHTFVYRIWWD
jgi:hypothetical protein